MRKSLVIAILTLASALSLRAAITINEVMAKNEKTLYTKMGFAGLDWVELYNSGDEDVDITGWYFGNDPTKKTSKWPQIEGSCIVPAKGYKILWCDGDGLCTSWASDEAHVAINVSTDAGKHTLFFAPEAKVSSIVEQITMPAGIKDISYGRGYLSRTLVAADAPAQYKIGSDDWKAVSGSVGMSAQSSGFEVVTYKIDPNLPVTDMDVADACLNNPSCWTSVMTNWTDYIAYKCSNSGLYYFPNERYSDFPIPDGNIILVIKGTLKIPETGDWTFSVGSDDGFSAKLMRGTSEWTWESRSTRGYMQSASTFNLTAGAYDVELRYFDIGGWRTLDFSASKGRKTFETVDWFTLVGCGTDIVHAGALSGKIVNDVASTMLGRSTLLYWKSTFTLDEAPAQDDTLNLAVQYADGFTAKLNDTVVATVAAETARTAAETLTPVTFPIDASKLVKGENTLKITVENNAINDTECYLSAELVQSVPGADGFVYFETPTPGARNGGGRTGMTPKVAFSVPHGWKDEAFDLALSCSDPTATIYYTLDGTSPKIGSASTFPYTEPIHIDKTTAIRAAVPDEDSILQLDTSATYLFYDDVIQQSSATPAGFPDDGAVNGQRMLYGLSKAVTEGDADTRARLKRGFTETTRTISFVIDPKNLFDGASGIYVNATGNGREWERQTMAEQINPMDPSGADDFSISAGLRIRGAASRAPNFPKHSFRLFFRGEYGMGTLEHPLFGDEGVDEFEKIDFRTSQNYSWANDQDGDTFIHECFSRDSEGAMGKTYNRSRYYHLFINGIYWGLYQTEERVDQNYCASYNGGAAENYDIVRTSQPGYVTEVVEGEGAAWNSLWHITTQEGGYGTGYEANYNRILGLNPDGTRNENYPILLNVTNLVTFLLTVHFTEDRDSPVNVSGQVNNLIAFRNRKDGNGNEDGFMWNRHDAEHSMIGEVVYSNGSLFFGTPEQMSSKIDLMALSNFNPTLLNWKLTDHPAYRRVFADLVQKHMVHTGGAMTVPAAVARYRARMAEIDDTIVCESARWGHQYATKRTRQDWLAACDEKLSFITNRHDHLLKEYRRRGWIPSINAPVPKNGAGVAVTDGTMIAANDRLYLSDTGANTVYYTMDGSDPRGADDSVITGASVYDGTGLVIPADGASVLTRSRSSSGEWSALEAIEVKGQLPQSDPKDALRLYEALTSDVGGEDTGDYLVLTNITSGEIPLEGVKIVAWNAKKKKESDPSLTYVFGAGESILPGQSLTLTASEFPAGGKLTNSQVGLRIYDAESALVQDVFLDADWWNAACDGTGEHFIAKTLGAEAKTHADWKPSATALAGTLAVSELYTSTKDGGDTGEFIVLTNLDAKAKLDLMDVRLVAWNAKKKSEAEPSLTILFESLTIPAGGVVKLDQATYFGEGKLTNSKVGLKLYDAAEACAQEAAVDADWWDKACDGTGRSFLALEFGATVKDKSQWTPKYADWPEDPDTEITDKTTPADLGITKGAFATATTDELKKLVKWAKAQGVSFGGAEIQSMAFDELGNPATDFEAAYLLNCAVDEVAEERAAFKFASIEPGTTPSIDGSGYNGRVTVYGSESPTGPWEIPTAGSRFYTATLTR